MRKLFLILLLSCTICTAQSIMVGPNGPEVSGYLNGGSMTIILYNSPISNNYQLQYTEMIPSNELAPGATDSVMVFEGYKVFQLLDSSVYSHQNQDTNLVKLVYQCDLINMVDTLINAEFDSISGCINITKVAGANTGIVDTIVLNNNAFTGLPFQPGDQACFIAVAYAFNEFKINPNCSNDPAPYLEGYAYGRLCLYQLTGDESILSSQSHLFPNPATDFLRLSIDDPTILIKEIRIIGIDGSVLLCNRVNEPATNVNIDVTSFKPGFYVMDITTESGITRKSFIKQ